MPANDPYDRASGSDATADTVASTLGDRDLVVVSNREPYSHDNTPDGGYSISRPAGGLTSALDPVMQALQGTWVAWGDGDADRDVVDEHDHVKVPPETEAYDLRRVWLTDDEVNGYYYGYSNQVLWPLCHLKSDTATFADKFWHHYRDVNETFADAVVEEATENALVWFQDYHLALAPRLVREQLSDDVFLTHFWHIPWPSWDTFQACPQHEQLLGGLLANDLLGFHTDRYCRNFLDCVDAVLDADVDWTTGAVEYNGEWTQVQSFPLGVDADAYADRARSNDGIQFWESFVAEHNLMDVAVAVGVDRLDYTKGLLERLQALERLWDEHPEWQEEVTYVQKASETRTQIDEYREHQEEVEARIEAINDRFGTDDWTPIIYLTGMYSQEELATLYRGADLALVSPLKDGMNLVAKEYVAANVDNDGVLVLSELAGASEELGDDALLVHPHDTAAFADAIENALTMSKNERRRRMHRLRDHVETNNVYAWITRVLQTVSMIERSRTHSYSVTRGQPSESRSQ